MLKTKNLQLNKPEYTDVADISAINTNMDILDEEVADKLSKSRGGTVEEDVTFKKHIITNSHIMTKDGNIDIDLATDTGDTLEIRANGEIFKIGSGMTYNSGSNCDYVNFDAEESMHIDLPYGEEFVVRSKKDGGIIFSAKNNSSSKNSDAEVKIGENVSLRTYKISGYKDANENKLSTIENFKEIGADKLKQGGTGIDNLFADIDHTHNNATTSKNGFMSATDKIKLDGIATGATKVTVDSALNSTSTNPVQNKVLNTALGNKANTSHSHTMEDLSGTLPIANGGTGGTTAATARSNLGLGTAATYGVSTTPTSGSSNLITSGGVYSAIEGISNRTHIIIATYNTQNPLKANADYTCTSSNATTILKNAISAVKAGGIIELLDGTFNLQYSENEIVIDKAITIKGSGYSTVINQPTDTNAGEAKETFNITSQNVRLMDMMLCDSNISSPVSIIHQANQGAIYDNVFFIFNGAEVGCENACISGSEDCQYTRIQNCRVYKGFNNSGKYMFNFGGCSAFGGVISGNISSGYNDISVKFASEGHKNNTAIYGHKAFNSNY